MNQLAKGVASPVGHTPTEEFGGAGEYLGLTRAILVVNALLGNCIAEAARANDGKEAVANVTFDDRGILDRGDTTGILALKHGPKAFTNAGGVYDDMPRAPALAEGLELAKYGEMVEAGPGTASQDAVGGALERFKGREVDSNDGEGNGIAGGIGQRGVAIEEEARRGGNEGLVLPGDIEEEGDEG